MSAVPPPAIVLLAPAFDPGVPVSSGPAAGTPLDPATTDAAPDPLAVALAAGTLERRPVASRPWESRLMARLGLDGAQTSAFRVPAARLLGPDDLSDAPLTAAGDVAGAAASGRLVVADPISLTPGRDEATLAPPEVLRLTPEEADALIAAANALLGDDGLAFARGRSGRWYLAGMDAAALDTPPTHFLARREAGAHLPAAGDAAPWRRLMAELEMLWHAHPVNEARLARGAPAVNGVWFWGGEPLPDVAPAARPLVVTDDPLATALARHPGALVETPTAFGPALDAAAASASAGTSDGTLLIVDTSAYAAWLADDGAALERARTRLAETWLAPAAQAVLDARAGSLLVAGGDGSEARFVPPSPRPWYARLVPDRLSRRLAGRLGDAR